MRTKWRNSLNTVLKIMMRKRVKYKVSPLFCLFWDHLKKNNIPYEFFHPSAMATFKNKDRFIQNQLLTKMGNFYVAMRVPDYYITNFKGHRHFIQGFHICMTPMASAFNFARTVFSTIEIEKNYNHSHMGSGFIGGMCFGGIGSIFGEASINAENFEYKLNLMIETFQWESLEGVPMNRIPTQGNDDTAIDYLYPILSSMQIQKYLIDAHLSIKNGRVRVELDEDQFHETIKYPEIAAKRIADKQIFINGITKSVTINNPTDIVFKNLKLKSYVQQNCEEYIGGIYKDGARAKGDFGEGNTSGYGGKAIAQHI